MKIKSLVEFGVIKIGDYLDACVSPNKLYACAYDSNNSWWIFQQDQFEIVEETRLMSEVLDEVSHSIEYKCPEKSYTLEELKALKELLK